LRFLIGPFADDGANDGSEPAMPVASLARDGGSCALAPHLVASPSLGDSLPVDAVSFPISLRLIGRHGDDARFCAIAEFLARQLGQQLENDIQLRSRSGQ
jgi:Asp-tRNA(Asn)/Glu-tRNA(Gln) amidotransferase A subunit family amidase